MNGSELGKYKRGNPMSLTALIYLASVLSKIHFFSMTIIIAILVVFSYTLTGCLAEYNVCLTVKKNGNALKVICAIFIISVFVFALTPNEKEVYAMLAVNKASELKLDETTKKGLEVLNIKLDEIIAESKGNKK